MSKPCELTVQRTAAGYLIRVAGTGTNQQSPAVRDFSCGAIEDGAEIVLDLSRCDYLDSTFQGCLVVINRRANKQDGRFGVIADAATCKRLFGSTCLEQILPMRDEAPATQGSSVALPVVKLERREFGQHLLETHDELAKLGGPQGATFRALVDQLSHELNEEDPTGKPPPEEDSA